MLVQLPDYLWGIETNQSSWTRFFLPGFQTTYEELKHIETRREDQSTLLPDYLWGIETKSTLKPISGHIASRLPMRNWNMNSSFLSCRMSSGFQTTYEELKPVENQDIQNLDVSFQTTYEELKQRQNKASFSDLFASRLPMRNWNEKLQAFPFPVSFSLPDYLWGIETGPPSPLSQPDLASRLPMRNWNFQDFLKLLDFHASRLPMRNWNSVLMCLTVIGESFQTTYEELKRSWSVKSPWRNLQASRLPMRNWNESSPSCPFRSWRASRLPMRNWNSVFVQLNSVRSFCFQTTYEELKLNNLIE